MEQRMKRFIASTDVNGPAPHVVAQWKGDDLIEVLVSNLTGGPVTAEQYMRAWQVASDMRAVREES